MTKRPNSELLVKAGRAYVFKQHSGGPGVRCLKTGKPHEVLQLAALKQAKYQARVLDQGHHKWAQRKKRLLSQLPGYQIEENVAEAWPDDTRVEAATEMFYSWERSPGHWSLCQRRCQFYGINMAKGDNGIWYATLLVAWKT